MLSLHRHFCKSFGKCVTLTYSVICYKSERVTLTKQDGLLQPQRVLQAALFPGLWQIYGGLVLKICNSPSAQCSLQPKARSVETLCPVMRMCARRVVLCNVHVLLTEHILSLFALAS